MLSERDDTPAAAQIVAPRPLLKDELVAPRTGTEAALAKLWSECIGVEPVGVRDNFFELGGHSLIALKLVDRINQTLDWDLSAVDMFKFPTIERLADANAAHAPGDADDAGAPRGAGHDARDDAPRPPAQPDAGAHADRRRRHYYQSRKHSMESKSE